jgi:hypothetical protein
MTLKDVFSKIYMENMWGSPETRSGGGSEIARTEQVRYELPLLLAQLHVQTFLDAGCGDWHWMCKLDLSGITCYACDIVPQLVIRNHILYGEHAHFFICDLVSGKLPPVDLVLCRATLFHLSLEHVSRALDNFKGCATYLLTTTHPNTSKNVDIQDGQWRRLNLRIEPFDLPAPVNMFWDGPGEDGCLALWKTSDL